VAVAVYLNEEFRERGARGYVVAVYNEAGAADPDGKSFLVHLLVGKAECGESGRGNGEGR
jgi:hypothetical protein